MIKRIALLLVVPVLISCQGRPPLPPATQLATVTPAESTPTIAPPSPSEPTATPPPANTPISASEFPNPDDYTWNVVASGLQRPVDLQHAGDGSGRLFIIEKQGRIRILQAGQLLESPFLDITDRVGNRSNEQGLLGLAFHPQYRENGRFFVNYTDTNGNTVIARYQVTTETNRADPASEVVLLRAEQPFPNHNGGGLDFGPDGYLYAGLGDGGSGGDPLGNAQNLNTPLGKILRFDVDGGEPYVIPPGNPFGNEIWAYGLRNPWRIAFDENGDLYIGDVGQNAWEEIDFIPAGSAGGLNFGWNFMEGNHPYDGGPQDGLTAPIAEYNHSQGCSVTGGYVYRGAMIEWAGVYFFGDYCSGNVWGVIRSGESWQARLLFDAGVRITSFGQDESGEVYIVDDGGQILRLDRR